MEGLVAVGSAFFLGGGGSRHFRRYSLARGNRSLTEWPWGLCLSQFHPCSLTSMSWTSLFTKPCHHDALKPSAKRQRKLQEKWQWLYCYLCWGQCSYSCIYYLIKQGNSTVIPKITTRIKPCERTGNNYYVHTDPDWLNKRLAQVTTGPLSLWHHFV